MSAPMDSDPRDPLFKGCTRPAMLLGVPLVPLMVVMGGLIILSTWTTILLGIVVAPPAFLAMRYIAKDDDQAFRLLALRLRFRVLSPNRNARFWRASTYSPFQFTKRK